MKISNSLPALSLVALFSLPLAAFATPITPGGATVTASNAIDVSGSIIASTSGNLTAGTYTGTYEEYVVSDATNPYGANDLTFVVAVSNNAGSPNGIEHVSLGSASGFSMFPSVNVGYGAAPGDDGNDVPVTVDESLYGTVEFNFTGSDAIAPGTGTEYLIIQTAATNYMTGNLSVIDSSTDTVNGYVPAAATPEPSSIALLGTGLLGVAGVIRRRLA